MSVREFTTAFSNWRSTVAYLMVQYLSYRARTGKFATLFMLAEPLIFILGIYLVRGLIRGALAHYGTSTLLFLVTGFFPYFLFVRTSTLSRRTSNPRQPLPRIRSIDVFLAQLSTNALLWIFAMALLHWGMWAYGIDQALPDSLVKCAIALLMLILLGAGLGLLNAAISRFFPFWLTLYPILMRGMLFFSGVIHIADFYPVWLRDWIVWNPVLHALVLFRDGVYGTYPSMVLDESYLVKFVIVLLFIGVVADRATLRHGGR